jgi:SAM-dependent methyltransferase
VPFRPTEFTLRARPRLRQVLALALVSYGSFTTSPALAQGEVGVGYVPTPMPVVEAMLSLGRIGPGDVVYDLGSGDGRILITAARRSGVRGVGYEIQPWLVELSREGARTAGVAERVEFVVADLFQADLRPASVVMLYLSPTMNLQLKPALLSQLRPGSRVVSHAFHMGGWQPDTVVRVGEGLAEALVYGWTVPARIPGFWQLTLQLPGGGEQLHVLEVDQRFQRFDGAIRREGRAWPITGGELAGDRLGFAARDTTGRRPVTYRFTGRVSGTTISGTYTSSASARPLRWEARRFSR